MGAVYEAIDEKTSARVAVKVVHAEVMRDASSRDDTSKLTRFAREAKAASAIRSPHVAQVTDWGTDEGSGQPFMVMELLEGEDLQQVLKRVQLLPPDVALRIVAQACKGLEKAHEARVTHRDIKPANLFLAHQASGEAVVKLLDFGIAKVRPEMDDSGDTTNLTRTGSMLGSPRYMSPEQARGSRSLDHRSDLWSLGVVLYRAMTGHMPHEDAEAMGDFIVLLCSEPPKRVQKYAPWLSAEVAAIVEGALQIDREKRFASAAAMLAAIEPLLAGSLAIRTEHLVTLPAAARQPHPTSEAAAGAGAGARAASPGPAGRPDARGSAPGTSAVIDDPTVPLVAGAQAGRGLAGAPYDVRPSGPSADGSSAQPPPSSPRREDATTPNTLANAPVETARRASRPVAPVVAGLGLLALAALAFGVLRGSEPGTDRPADGSTTSAAAASSAPPEALRRANLVIFPGDASVEVDGKQATSHDGVVEIAGAIGSVHRVRVSKDGHEKTTDVVLGDSGAEPPKVELSMLAPSGSTSASGQPATGQAATTGARPGPTTKKTAAPGTSAAPGPPKNPLMPERFE